MKQIDVNELKPSDFYQHMTRMVVPRPIAWVSTRSDDGVDNIAPFSYFTGVGSRPPTILFCPANQRDGRPKDTLANIQQNGQFVVNVVTHELSQEMQATAASVAPDQSEFDVASLETVEAEQISVARVKRSPVQLECRLRELFPISEGPGGANIVLGDVLLLHIDPAVQDADGYVDPGLLDAVGRLGGQSYCRTQDRFDLDFPG